ncbi:MAG: hypothetical protein NT130_05805 [Candidatus Micrarchaeota archaeon]|nr:hypothetical protein [Candidatus Micrarchaeota archaeon]
MEFQDSFVRFLWQILVIWAAIFLITSMIFAVLDAQKLAAFNLGLVVFISAVLLILELTIEILLESKTRRSSHEHKG